MIFDAFARRLRGRSSWRREQEHVAQLVVERPQDTLDFAAVLDLELERRGFDAAVHAVRSSLLDLVCSLVHDDATHLAARLAARPAPALPEGPGPSVHRSQGAMQIAATRPAAQIWQLLTGPDGLREHDPEFAAFLLHELVVRDEPVPPSAGWCAQWARDSGHPLAWLPPELLAIEAGLPGWLPRYPRAVGARAIGAPGTIIRERVPLGDIVNGLGAALPVDRDRISATFAEWVSDSNVRLDVRGYAPGTTFPYGPAPCLTRALPVSRIAPAGALEALFSTAVASGAYSTGPGGSLARLRSWQAVSGVVGSRWPVPIDELAAAAARTHWIKAAPEDPWFEGVAWDVWLIGATSERIVVIAATDTD